MHHCPIRHLHFNKMRARGVSRLMLAMVSLCLISGFTCLEPSRDIRLDGHSFRIFNNIGLQMCVQECQRHSDCLSINYDLWEFKCGLNDAGIECCSDSRFKLITGSLYVQVANGPQTSVSPCSTMNCPPRHRCVVSHSGTADCIISECEKVSLSAPVEVLSSVRQIGTGLKFNCTSPFSVNPSKYPTCKPEGHWNLTSNLCMCRPGRYNCDSSCCNCQPGYYSWSWGSSSCDMCPEGRYQQYFGKSYCNDCPAGTYQPDTGSTLCLDCPAGQYTSEEGQVSCHECDIGTFQNETKQLTCIDCPRGQYQSTKGSMSCLDCDLGWYQDQRRGTECTECPKGKYQNQRGSSSCLNCETGSHQDKTGQSSCKPCKRGHYQDKEGEDKCDKCPDNYYQDLTGQLSCKYCDPGTSPWRKGVVHHQCVDCFSPSGGFNTMGTGDDFTEDDYTIDECAAKCADRNSCKAFTFETELDGDTKCHGHDSTHITSEFDSYHEYYQKKC